MKLYIKNMVSNHCITKVKNDLDKIGIQYTAVKLGEVNTNTAITALQRTWLDATLQKSGYELIDEQKNELIESLKLAIITLENQPYEELNTGLTDYIRLNTNENPASVNLLYAQKVNITTDKYITRYKTDKVKELLVYDNLTLAEIDQKMHYTTVTQLSNQFKRITGLTHAHFRLLRLTRFNNPLLN